MLLGIEDVSAGYGRVEVLRSISLSLMQGECIGLFGPNGHGKTTLLRTISGLIKPTGGRIVFEGQDIAGLPPHQIVSRGLIHVPQGSALFPRMTVSEVLMLGAYSSRAWQQRSDSLKRVHKLFPILKDRSSQLTRTLSGGQRQMVAIGTGLMAVPSVLMLDEPTLGLAPRVKDELASVIGEIAQSGVSIVLVDQDLELLLELSDRLYLVERGAVSLETKRGETISQQDVLERYFGKAVG